MATREISPLDGRYQERLAELSAVFSEFALMRERCLVEAAYVEALEGMGLFVALTPEEKGRISSLADDFCDADFDRIKAIEAETNHDVKACEIFLRERLELGEANRIHFGLTSEDVNNLAYGRLLDRYRSDIQLPQLRKLIETLTELAERWKGVVFPARTHGQPASPTTLGKELAVFLSRLLRQAVQLNEFRFRGKLNGATGTFAAFAAAAPEIDWPALSERFVAGLGLEPNACTTQIEDHDTLAEYFAIASRINAIVRDLDRDMWLYISHGDLVQKVVTSEVGSSTMPHKVNPIRFENSEGNVAIANALLLTMADWLTQSRMQRDLSDTTVKRNIGVALAHGHLAIDEALRGLDRIDVDEAALRAKVEATPEILTEGIQTILRLTEVEDPYELLRGLTRGEIVALQSLHEWIDKLQVADEVKERLKNLKSEEYIGFAPEICDRVVERARAWLKDSA